MKPRTISHYSTITMKNTTSKLKNLSAAPTNQNNNLSSQQRLDNNSKSHSYGQVLISKDKNSICSSSSLSEDDDSSIPVRNSLLKVNNNFTASKAEIELEMIRKKYEELNFKIDFLKEENTKLIQEKKCLKTLNDANNSSLSNNILKIEAKIKKILFFSSDL